MYFSYIDPGTGSMLVSATIALLSVGFFMIKGLVYRKLNIGGDKGEQVDPNEKFGLVFYSEGKQYWNVFYPLLDECEQRKIKATFFTSDREDSALKKKYEYIDIKYIGSGREAYFILNRLKADVVVMTTPGLDVLELKRSPHVNHYSHITHATGSFAGYKSYAVDYFDSVLIGGSGDIEVIQELESLRNMKSKEIKVVGITYLDVLREKIANEKYEYTLFREKKPTILISPTWGNHGILTKYGEKILTALTENDNFNVIIRPHPQSFISEIDLMEKLMKQFPNSENVVWNRDIDNLKVLSHADIMISDFSGIIFDFYALFDKPILTISGQYEKRGRDAIDLKEDPWDIKMLDEIGKIIDDKDIGKIISIVEKNLTSENEKRSNREELMGKIDRHPNNSKVKTMDYIQSVIEKTTLHEEEIVVDESSTYEEGSFNSLYGQKMIFEYFLGSLFLSTLIYCGSKIFYAEGLNQLFLNKILPYSVMASGLILLSIVILTWVKNKGSFKFSKSSEKFSFSNMILIAFPMTPIVQYIFSNQDILNLKSSLIVFMFFAVISIIIVVLVPWLLSPIVSTKLISSIAVSYLFIIFNMASFGKLTSKKYIVILMIMIVAIYFILQYFEKKKLLIIVSLIFFATSFVTSILSMEEVSEELVTEDFYETTEVASLLKGLELKNSPNIYLLVYDAYANEETMKQYNHDNSSHYNYLLENGFTIYDGSYSVAANSLASMGSTLSFEPISLSNVSTRNVVAGHGSVMQMLRHNNYATETVFSSDYLIQDTEPLHEIVYPGSAYSIAPHKIIINAILEGEFRFDAEFSTIEYSDYLEVKLDRLSTKSSSPRLFYSHDENPGHSQNSGVLLPNETELFIERLQKANTDMQKDIKAIRENDENALIIVAGDHGPYLTKNGVGLDTYDISEIDRLDVQDRYGTFIAISWPENGYSKRYDIKLLQDIFPAIVSYMYEEDFLFDELRLNRETFTPAVIGGISVVDGIIIGGIDDGKPLFEINTVREKIE